DESDVHDLTLRCLVWDASSAPFAPWSRTRFLAKSSRPLLRNPGARLALNLRSAPTPRLSALRRGELAYLALHAIALAVTLHRRDRVVVRRPRLGAPHLPAECRLRMALVQPGGVSRRPVELLV